MARPVSIQQLRADVADQCDVVVGATGRYSASLINRYLNKSIQRFRERLSTEGITHYLVSASGTLTSGATSPYPFQVLDMSGFDPAVVRTFGVDITWQGVVQSLEHRPFQDRATFGAIAQTGMPIAWAHFQTDKIAIFPAPDAGYSYTVWYLPAYDDLEDGQSFDGVAGWEDYLVQDVVCRLISRDQYREAYQQANAQREGIWADILRAATKVSAAGSAVKARDTFGAFGPGYAGRFSRGIVGAGGGLPPTHSVTNTMLAEMAAYTIKANVTASLAQPTDATPAQVAAILPAFAGTTPGLVPTGVNNSALFLNQTGGWSAPSVGGSVTGVSLSQLADISAPVVLGRFGSATGPIQQMSGAQVASMIPWFSTTRAGLVPVPSGGAAGLVLRDDGTWAAAGGSGTGISNAQLGAMPPGTVKGRFTLGSGLPEDLTPVQVASLLPNFYAASGGPRGLVYSPTAGVGGLFLRDDGSWQTPAGGSATGVANNQLGPMAPLSVKGNTLSASGTASDLTKQQVASLLPDFWQASGASRGFVWAPTGGVAGLFLRDDGTWNTPSAGGATGVGNTQLLAMPPLSFKGNFGSASGSTADLTKQQAASLMPDFWQGSGASRGFVSVPTAGVTNRFLRDDGSWQSPPTGTIPAPSGLALAQLGDIQSPRFIGRITAGSGVREELTPNQAASMLPDFFAPSGGPRGLVRSPTGGVAGLFLRDDGTWQTAGGSGGGPTMLAAGPLGAVQFNGGSGFAGASGFRYDTGSGAYLDHNFVMPTGTIILGDTATGLPSAAGSTRIIFPHGTVVLGTLTVSGQNTIGVLRVGGPGLRDNAVILGGNVNGSTELRAASGGDHRWLTSGVVRGGVESTHQWLESGMRLGLQQLALPDSVGDKLGGWTASGFANIATGINITASGTRLSVGSGGPQLHASGIDMRSGDIRNVRRLNGLDGIKLYGDLPDSNENITEPSGTAFIIPGVVTAGRVYTIVPSGTEHGKVVLIENRSAFSHSIYNSGTGMGAPSGWIATLAPSGGMSARFASGAWEFGSKYQLGGF